MMTPTLYSQRALKSHSSTNIKQRLWRKTRIIRRIYSQQWQLELLSSRKRITLITVRSSNLSGAWLHSAARRISLTKPCEANLLYIRTHLHYITETITFTKTTHPLKDFTIPWPWRNNIASMMTITIWKLKFIERIMTSAKVHRFHHKTCSLIRHKILSSYISRTKTI